MTVAAELAKQAGRLEYFVTIEGLGWPVNGLFGSLAGGFDGQIWVTNDIDGDLDTQLQGNYLTIRKGLHLPSSVSESIDPRNASYTPSGLSFTIVDHDDILVANITPRKAGTYLTIASGHPLEWGDDTPYLSGTPIAAGSTYVWVGGRELIWLGAQVVDGVGLAHYTGSYRGHLGTQRGSSLRRPEDYCLGVWPEGTCVYTVPWWWFNRQVALWAHVPGESAANCQLVWYGRLRPIKNPGAGPEYRFDAVGDFISTVSRIYRAIDWQVSSVRLADGWDGWLRENWLYAAAKGGRRLLEFSGPDGSRFGADGNGLYELAAAYQYRNVPGGLEGMVTSWDGGSVQARDIDDESDALYSYVWADESAWLMHSRETAEGATSPFLVRAGAISKAGKSRVAMATSADGQSFSGGHGVDFSIAPKTPARFLLDNMQRKKYKGRFNLWASANGGVRHTRHPIDVALMFMLSTDRELTRGDTAAGSTATVINFTTNAPADGLIGKALFCMEGNGGVGTAPEMEACPITDNTTTSATIEGGFSTAPNAAIEVQVRNSIYDVLPLGWGMGIDCRAVDVEAFERIRDEDIPEARLGDFILGVQDEIDIWALINDNIFKPYGILVYFDYSSRQISAKYLGVTPTDGVFDDFIAVDEEDIYDAGDVTHIFSNPIGQVSLTVRSVEERVVGTREYTPAELDEMGAGTTSGQLYLSKVIRAQRAAMMGGRTTKTIIKSDEINIAFGEHHLDRLDIEAMLNTDSDDGGMAQLAGRICGMIGEYSVPPPVWSAKLDISLYQDLKPGVYCLINWNTNSSPANPFTGSRGWTDVVGRVLSRSYPIDSSTCFSVQIELLTANLTARIAPAVIVTAKGSDGLGEYFECATAAASQNYVSDPDNDKDWYKFAVDDELEHRDSTGAVKAGWTNRSITGFGTDERADPTTAPGSPMRIYVDGGIGSAVAAGDYITLAAWPTSCPARRQRYSSYADASAYLGPDNDNARVYA